MAHNLIVLAAGYAVRMGELTRERAKPLLEVAGRPMMDWVQDRCGRIPGLRRSVTVSNSRFHRDFASWCGRWNKEGVTCHVELLDNGSTCRESKRGAIGDLWFAIEEGDLFDEDLLVVGGDNLFSVPPASFVDFSRGKPAVIGTCDVGSPEEVRRFASIETDSAGRIVEFEEKPLAPRGTVAGIALYWFDREVVPLVGEYLRKGNNPDQAGHLIAWLRGEVETYGCPVEGEWFDIGNAESLAEADRVFREVAPAIGVEPRDDLA